MSTSNVQPVIHTPLGETISLDPLPTGSTLGGQLSWTKKGELTANITLPSGVSAQDSTTQVSCLDTYGNHSATIVKGTTRDTISGTQDITFGSPQATITGTDVLHDASGKIYSKVDFHAVTDTKGHWSAQTSPVSVPASATHLTWTAVPNSDNPTVSTFVATPTGTTPGHATATFDADPESDLPVSPSTTDLASCVVGTQRSSDALSTALQQTNHVMIDSLETAGGVGLAVVLAASAITRAIRSSRRPVSGPVSEPAPAFDTERHEALLARRADLDSRWLSYDKDLAQLVARPAMRNFHCEATRDAAEHIEAVMHVDTHDLDLFDETLCEAEQAFAYAEMCAGNMALCGLDARQRKIAKRAQDALSLMLDAQATQSEIAGALHVVESSLKALVPDMAPEVHNNIRRQIADKVRVPLQIESPAVVAASLAEGTIPQRVYIETRITRAGEASINHLTELARSMSLQGGGTHQEASDLRDIIDDLRQTFAMLSDIARDPEVPEVARHAAGSRLTAINEALTLAGQINATLAEKVTV